MNRAALALLVSLGATSVCLAAARLPDDPWRDVRQPAAGPAESFGGYDDGCVRGARALPLSGPGFEVMRPERHRYFGHPRLVAFVEQLARRVSSDGLGTLMIGDLGQPRGGPTLSGHASHQTGLDVDIWYRQLPAGARLTRRDREKMSTPAMVQPDFERLNRHWNPNEMEILRLAASDPAVDRIFVDPMIKKTICGRYGGAPWLAHLRPWWGHDDHFHVRLNCPPGDAQCVNRADPLPPGDGCDATLEAWFTPQSKEHARKLRTEPSPPPTMPKLPDACAAVLAEQPGAPSYLTAKTAERSPASAKASR